MSQFSRVQNTDSENKGPKIKELKSSRIEIQDTSSFEDYQRSSFKEQKLYHHPWQTYECRECFYFLV